jgi:hypothetical protein
VPVMSPPRKLKTPLMTRTFPVAASVPPDCVTVAPSGTPVNVRRLPAATDSVPSFSHAPAKHSHVSVFICTVPTLWTLAPISRAAPAPGWLRIRPELVIVCPLLSRTTWPGFTPEVVMSRIPLAPIVEFWPSDSCVATGMSCAFVKPLRRSVCLPLAAPSTRPFAARSFFTITE